MSQWPYDKATLVEIADDPVSESPHLCSQGIAMGTVSPQPGQILSVDYCRRLGARLLLVADEAEDFASLVESGRFV